MTSVQQRQNLLSLIGQACADGAPLKPACRQIGLSCRSVQRWQRTQAAEGDQRPSGKRRCVRTTSCVRKSAKP
jgi:putative transposase